MNLYNANTWHYLSELFGRRGDLASQKRAKILAEISPISRHNLEISVAKNSARSPNPGEIWRSWRPKTR